VIEALRGARTLLGLAWRGGRLKTVLAVALMLGQYAAAPLVALSLKELTNESVRGDAAGAAIAGAVTALLVLAGLTLGHFAHIAYFELSDLNILAIDEDLIMLANGSAGIEHQERADYADRLQILREGLFQLQASL
jgi:ATP-binding cassette subfamily B protein